MKTDIPKANGKLVPILKELSKAMEKPQRQQAKDMGYHPQELYGIFHDLRAAHVEDVERIAGYLGYEIRLEMKGEKDGSRETL
jgi:hypothetical protein